MLRRQKLFWGIGVGSILAASFVAYAVPPIKQAARISSEIIVPAQKLDQQKLQKQLLSEVKVVSYSNSNLDPFHNALADHPELLDEIMSCRSTQDYYEVTRSKTKRDIILAWATTKPENLEISNRSAIQEDQHRDLRGIGRGLVLGAQNSYGKIPFVDVLQQLEWAAQVANRATFYPEPQAVVTVFGIEIDIMRFLAEIVGSKSLKANELDLVVEFIQRNSAQIKVSEVLKRQLSELILASENLEHYSKAEINTLNAENRNTGWPYKHDLMPKAMNSTILELWMAVTEFDKKSDDDEMIGVEIDSLVNKMGLERGYDGYLIRTLGSVYEQVGRTQTRVNQAKVVVANAAYAEQYRLKNGEYPSNVPGQKLLFSQPAFTGEFEYSREPRGFLMTAETTLENPKDFRRVRLDINQTAGVRYNSLAD